MEEPFITENNDIKIYSKFLTFENLNSEISNVLDDTLKNSSFTNEETNEKTISIPEKNNFENILKIVEHKLKKTHNEDPFYVVDLNTIINQFHKWNKELIQFQPFYAVKCNNDPEVLKTLVSLGLSFDCASMEEIKTMLSYNVDPKRIIYANPCKHPNYIKFAKEKGIDLMTFDNKEELFKILDNHPNAKLVMRIHVDDSKSVCQLGIKFGVRDGNTKPLLELAKDLGLKIIGVSFHVGSGCLDPELYSSAITRAREVFEEAKQVGFKMTLLDIGGGFPGLTGIHNGVHINFEEIASVIKKSMLENFPDNKFDNNPLTLIAEPGRFFVSAAFTLATFVTSKRTIDFSNHQKSFMFYINDGVYGSFNCLIFDHAVLPFPKIFHKNPSTNMYEINNSKDLFNSSIWGPTCDSMDCLTKNILMQEVHVGDWLIFENMGAYTLVAASKFNGMKKPKTIYFNSETSELLLKPTKLEKLVIRQKISFTKSDDDYS